MASRFRAKYRGTIDSITIPPAAAAPSFSAVVVTEPAHERIRLMWIGQRQIAGISAGTALEFEGMISVVDGASTIYNPRYEIIRPQERT